VVSLMCRYGLNRLKFQYVDKFLLRAVIFSYSILWDTGILSRQSLEIFITSFILYLFQSP